MCAGAGGTGRQAEALRALAAPLEQRREPGNTPGGGGRARTQLFWGVVPNAEPAPNREEAKSAQVRAALQRRPAPSKLFQGQEQTAHVPELTGPRPGGTPLEDITGTIHEVWTRTPHRTSVQFTGMHT